MSNSHDKWQEELDNIVADKEIQCSGDDELEVAKRLHAVLAPLKNRDRTAVQHQQQTLARLHGKQHIYHPPVRSFARCPLLVAMLLVLFLITVSMNIGIGRVWERTAQLWHVSTSTDQFQGVSVASLSKPHKGLRPLPLLPAILPTDTQASNYGVITATSDPNVLTTFVADYHIAGNDVLLYEQLGNDISFSSVAQRVKIGPIEGQLFQDDAGNNALQWYQHGMICQLTSKLVPQRLQLLASTFQPMKNWDVIL